MRQQQCYTGELGDGSYIGKILIFLSILFVTVIQPVSALTFQDKAERCTQDSVCKKSGKKGLIRSFIATFSDVDTNYVRLNKYNMQAIMYSDLRFNVYNITATNDEDKEQSLTFSPNSKIYIGPYLGYSILFLGYTFNFGHQKTNAERTSTHISVYAPLFGIDYYYQKGESNYHLTKSSGFTQDKLVNDIYFNGLDTYLQHLHVYYVFNHRRFSYTAAYSQSRQQIRSSGSLMLGFNYTQQRLKFDYNKLPTYILSEMYDELKMNNIHYNNYSVSIGYSYNWSFARNWLFNITVDPSIGYNINKGEKMELNSHFLYNNFNFDMIARSSLVWNTGLYFGGIQGVAHTYSYKKSTFSVTNALFDINAYIGFNFWRKKR